MGFLADRDNGELGERITIQALKQVMPHRTFAKTSERKDERYDLIEKTRSKFKRTIEVKFDLKAYTTKNVCFEMTNGSRPTGVCASEADEVCYVFKTRYKNKYKVFRFNKDKLLQRLLYWVATKEKGVKVVNGGDKSKFGLVLIPVKLILDDVKKNKIAEIIPVEYEDV